jgi:putative ABC transport system substrate-binding protein
VPSDFDAAMQSAKDRSAEYSSLFEADLVVVCKANRGCRQRLSLAMIGSLSEIALAGGLLAYAVDLNEMARHRAWYVDEILRGTPPGDLPFEEVSKYQLFINVRTARALGAHHSTKPHRHF